MYHLPGSFKKGTYKQIINSSYDNGTYAQIDSNETVKIPVDKGIYYVQFGHTVRYKGEENKARKTGQFRYKFTRVKPTENFSPAKAETLSANKKVTVCVTQEYAYSRWYKISLPEKRKITIWGPQFDENDVTVYDSDLNYVETKQSGKNKRVTKLTQEKGTYYIRVFNDDNIEYDDIPVPSGLYTLKWK